MQNPEPILPTYTEFQLRESNTTDHYFNDIQKKVSQLIKTGTSITDMQGALYKRVATIISEPQKGVHYYLSIVGKENTAYFYILSVTLFW